MGLSFTIAAGPRQHSHSQVRVLLDLRPHFTVSDSRLPQPVGPVPRIYIRQEQGGPVIPPGTGLPFRRLLRLIGLRWRYSTPPPHRFTWKVIKVKATLRLTVSQPVSLGVEPPLGLMTRYLLLFDSYGLAFVGRPL
jgi:hypothetical protein